MANPLNQAAGVNYDVLDSFKNECQGRAALTTHNAEYLGIHSLEWTRGESVFCQVLPHGDVIGHVHEGLGTKEDVARAYRIATGRSLYRNIAHCATATAFNDAITLGVMPSSVSMYLAVGSSTWFEDEKRSFDLIAGWGDACDLAGGVWGPGETPELNTFHDPELIELNCSVVGYARNQDHLMNPNRIKPGAIIIFFKSNGIHANGLTKARKIAPLLSDGYLTQLESGLTYAQAILRPTTIYVPVVRKLLYGDQPIVPYYGVNVSGHGLRKLMRTKKPYRYVIYKLPAVDPEFKEIQRLCKLDDRAMYGSYNMNIGFALYADSADAGRIISVANECGRKAWVAGYIEDAAQSEVVLTELGITYEQEDLKIRR